MKARVIIPILVACVGIAFVIIGTQNGEMATICKKAIAICLECIGIG